MRNWGWTWRRECKKKHVNNYMSNTLGGIHNIPDYIRKRQLCWLKGRYRLFSLLHWHLRAAGAIWDWVALLWLGMHAFSILVLFASVGLLQAFLEEAGSARSWLKAVSSSLWILPDETWGITHEWLVLKHPVRQASSWLCVHTRQNNGASRLPLGCLAFTPDKIAVH